jgi:peptide/nickel transport system permease protein
MSRFLAIIGRCLPGFFTGLLILAYLYPKGFIVVDFYWTVKKITGMPTIDAILNLDWDAFVHGFKYLIGPLLTSIIGAFAQNTRILRSSILEEMSKDYIKTGKSKGLSTDYVNTKYARRNALIPFTTTLGYSFAWILSGNAVLESVFNRRGMGSVAAQAARMTDHNTLQAFAMIMATLLVTINLIVDIVYGYIDPRIKYGE